MQALLTFQEVCDGQDQLKLLKTTMVQHVV